MCAFQTHKKNIEKFALLPWSCSEIQQDNLNSPSRSFSSPSLYHNTTVYQNFIHPYISKLQPCLHICSFPFELTFHSSICLSYPPDLLCCLAASTITAIPSFSLPMFPSRSMFFGTIQQEFTVNYLGPKECY